MRYLLDTDTCIGVLRDATRVAGRLREHSPADLAVASMTLAELLFGARNSRRQQDAQARVAAFLDAPLWIVPFDTEAARHYAEIRFALKATPIGTADLLIAGTARANRLVVVTGNEREFGRVPGLAVENWLRGP